MNIELKNISKEYKETKALIDLSCKLSDGEFISFLGPSGSGKSTILGIIAGTMSPTRGKVLFDDKEVTDLPPKERNIGFVFQNYALYPNMTVRDNIEFPLEIMKVKKKEMQQRVLDIAKMVKISHLLEKRPHELSGGEQQRVALARALVKRPRLLLLDEPFSNLDPRLAADMRYEIKRLQMELGITTILVTHNQAEAMELSDRIALLSSGKLIQFGYATEIYNQPNNYFCAQFLGDMKINSIDGIISNGTFASSSGGINISSLNYEDGAVKLCFRPEKVKIGQSDYFFSGKVVAIYNRGREHVVDVDLGGNSIKLFTSTSISKQPQLYEDITVGVDRKDLLLYDKTTGNRRMEC